MASRVPLTVGTAGHIDHGKTALVEALTGKNTDRLAEEQRRGISIELGFAPLVLPDGRALSVVDVPGHDQLVRTMISGAAGVDLFLLVVAADDGVMPQTQEHLTVLRALGIDDGLVALTRCDLADERAIEHALQEVRHLLPGTRVVKVSARTGQGMDDLRAALAAIADRAQDVRSDLAPNAWAEPTVLHVDRAFSLRGIGTVVTGTLQGGSIAVGERVEIVSRGTHTRIRHLHVHGQEVQQAPPAQRVAMNLAGVPRRGVSRGDVITTRDSGLRPSYRLDIELSLEPFAGHLDGKRVQIHHGTRAAPARLVHLDEAGRFAQLRLHAPLVAAPGDRVVIRQIAPPDTLGGGEVIDPVPTRHGLGTAAERLGLICDGCPEEILEMVLSEGPIPTESDRWRLHSSLAPALGRHPPAAWQDAAKKLERDGALALRDGAMTRPATAATSATALPDAAEVLGERDLAALEMLRADGIGPRSPQALAEALGVEPDEALSVLKRLARAGAARCVRPGVYYEMHVLQRLREQVIALAAERGGSISLAELRDSLRTSRKYAQALLEHFDNEKDMIRRGDRHHLRKSAGAEITSTWGGRGLVA